MKTTPGAHPLLRRFRDHVRREGLFARGDRLLLAVSGGPDSVALLYLLRALAPELGLSLAVAHLDHGLRGEASGSDARWVEALAARLGLPCAVGSARLAARGRKRRGSVEAAAREARYGFLVRAAARMGIRKIVLGHQADDLAETVLMRLLRGCGPEGLIGMRPVSARSGRLLVRPLLPFRRREILDFLRLRSIPYRRDATNRDTRFLRNRVRRVLLPYLERNYNPRLGEILAHLSVLMRRWAEGGLSGRPPAALRRALARSGAKALDRRHWAALAELRGKREGARTSLPGGRSARLERGRVVIEGRPVSAAVRSYRYPLPVPGAAAVRAAGVRIAARLVRAPRPLPRRRRSLPAYWRRLPPRGLRREYLDPASLSFPLAVRSRLPGDSYRPLGSGGSRKVKAIMIDGKIPPSLRPLIPLVVSGRRVVWLVGHRPAEDCRLREGSRLALELRAEPL